MDFQYVTDAHRRSYQERGFMILENMVAPALLELLRHEVDVAIADMHREMDRQGKDTLGINHRNKRYFVPFRYPNTHPFVFGDLMKQICLATLGDDAHLFLDQFVVKAAEQGMSFGWHQDSGYLGFTHDPYITCWTALDDVCVENGTVYLLPYDLCGIRTRVEHILDEATNDKVGYFGTEPGLPVIVPAGSTVVFSSLVFHRSGQNTTTDMRRVYLTQYSKETIINPATGKPMFRDVPFLKDGRVIADDPKCVPAGIQG